MLVKLPYLPKIPINSTETCFGVSEIDQPKIYETTPLDRTIIRVDLLDCLHSIFSPVCFLYRDLLYKIVSCSGLTHEEYQNLFASFYRRHYCVCLFVNEFYFFAPNPEVPLIDLVSTELLNKVGDYRKKILNEFDQLGAKFLVETHLYIYFAVKDFAPFENIPGVVLCSK